MDSVRSYYDRFPEERRLSSGAAQIEAARTKTIIRRFIPEADAVVLDVGGGAGAYSFWLANQGHEVHLVDASPRLIGLARSRDEAAAGALASVSVGDARTLEFPDGHADVVLLLGPMYHLTDPVDRGQALAEATRVLKHGGWLFAACITRWASLFDGLVNDRLGDVDFATMAAEDVASGEHRNPSGHPEWFTTSFFHRPDEFEAELRQTEMEVAGVFGLEGPAALLPDFETRWAHPDQRAALLEVASVIEREPSLAGISAHLLGVCRKR